MEATTEVAVLEPRRELTPMDLLNSAILKGIDPEGIKTLSQVMLDMQGRQAEREFNVALSQFQSECPIVLKNKSIQFPTKGGGTFSAKYADMDNIMDTTRDLRAKYGFSFSFDREITETHVQVICILRHAAGHQTRTPFLARIEKESKLSEAHAIAGATTFCERYAFRGALGITTGASDNDGKEFVSAPISKEQVNMLNKLLEETKADSAAFLKYARVASLGEILLKDYGRVEAALLERRRVVKLKAKAA